MSTHVVPVFGAGFTEIRLIRTQLAAAIREPVAFEITPENTFSFTFTPDLTPAEVTVFDDCVAAVRSRSGLGATDYGAIRTQMQTLRAMRQLGRNAYVNLTEAERNRQTHDCLVAITEIFLKLTRDV